MDTIFDHNITKRELELLNAFHPTKSIRDRDEYLIEKKMDRINADLYRLYTLRGDFRKADFYLKKVKDPTYKYFLSDF